MKVHNNVLEASAIVGWFGVLVCFNIGVVGACGGLQPPSPTVIRGTLGGLYGACQAVENPDPTWQRICQGVEQAMPAIEHIGAGPAELPPDVAAREVTITIGN